jgi:all-trans-retinol dehydrogenase (NAD+)
MFKGTKSRFGFLLPILDENYVAEKVVKAVISKRAVLKMPLLTYSVPLLRILPAKYFDMVADILGVSSSMDDFVGRKK